MAKTKFTKVKKEENIFKITNKLALLYNESIKLYIDIFFNKKQLAKDEYGNTLKDEKGSNIEVEYNFDASKVIFSDSLIYALNKSFNITERAIKDKENEDKIILSMFKKEFNLQDSDFSDKEKIVDISNSLKEYQKRDSIQDIFKNFMNKEFKGELHYISEDEIFNSIMPTDLKKGLYFLVKKEDEPK